MSGPQTSYPWVVHGNRSVVTDGCGNILWKLEKPIRRDDGRWVSYPGILTYPTKQEATKAARKMGILLDHVEQITGRLGFMPWVIRYDSRCNFYHADWEDV